jgi:antitoxin component HigA of HigAB toxin-antitoxin module
MENDPVGLLARTLAERGYTKDDLGQTIGSKAIAGRILCRQKAIDRFAAAKIAVWLDLDPEQLIGH